LCPIALVDLILTRKTDEQKRKLINKQKRRLINKKEGLSAEKKIYQQKRR